MSWTIFWVATALFSLGFLLMISTVIAQIIFIIRYSEKIRKIVINMPEYKPNWGFFTNFEKPIRAWDIVGSNLFVMRLIGIIYAKRSSPINEKFKSLLPKPVFTYIVWSFRIGMAAFILLFVGGGISYLQQHGILQ